MIENKLPVAAAYSDDYQRALHQAARHVAEAARVGFALHYVVGKARSLYRAAWDDEQRRVRGG